MADTNRENRLARESSPYLKAHARNPVDWYAWGDEALRRAEKEDLPIFLSIGYSSCHWCHVMERESFEDEQVAALMNERFVNIKVDREERPDLDEIYMAATQMLTGQGGWPNSVFLTSDRKPFFAGTYFPPSPRHGRPGFADVLRSVSDTYRSKTGDVKRMADEVTAQIGQLSEMTSSGQRLAPSILNRAFGDLAGRFDNDAGGFGGAPKFPHSMDVSLLLRYHRRTGNPEALRMAVLSLETMARGGIADQLGGGFHRYSVDALWLVPHFEKMLYDNALLARVYLEAAQAVGRLPVSSALPAGGAATAAYFKDVARDTLEWVLREMTSPEGGFYSSLDADSEGEEGKHYVWTPQEIAQVLGQQETGLFCNVYGVAPGGNFEHGTSVLHLTRPLAAIASELRMEEGDLRLRMASARSRLLKVRDRRIRPGRDEKILADWNGLMISALAFGARVLDEPRYAEAARYSARFVLDRMVRDGRLLHSCMGEQARHPAYLTDHAFLLGAFLDLYEATFDGTWIAEARHMAARLIEGFSDDRGGGFFFTARDHEALIARTREGNDGAVPAGASVAALALLRLHALTGDESLRAKVEQTLLLYRDRMERFPSAFGMMLCAVEQSLAGVRQIVLAARRDDPLLRPFLQTLRDSYDPNGVLILAEPGAAETGITGSVLAGKTPIDGRPAVYVCESGACRAPVLSAAELKT
jgi:uncharacterized protein YyaL (SSP411 family)